MDRGSDRMYKEGSSQASECVLRGRVQDEDPGTGFCLGFSIIASLVFTKTVTSTSRIEDITDVTGRDLT